MIIEPSFEIRLNAWGRVVKPNKAYLRRRYAKCATDVIVTLNGARDKRFRLYRPTREYVDAFEHFRELGVRVHVMSWIRPDVEWIEAMVAELAELREVAPFESALLDAEGQWRKGWRKGHKPRKARRLVAREVLADLTGNLLQAAGVPYGVTDVPLVGWGTFGPLVRAPHCTYAMPQAHEFGLRKGIRTPGRLVARTYKRWPKLLPPTVELIPHLAAYGVTQTGKGLQTSIEASIAHGATKVAAWTGGEFRHRACRKVLARLKQQIDVAKATKDQA